MVALEVVKTSTDEERHAADVSCIITYKDFVFSGSEEGVLKMWDTKTLSIIKEIRAHEYGILNLLAVNDMIFTSSMDSTIKAWSIPDLEFLRTLEGHEQPVKKMVYNGTHLLAGDYKGELKVWGLDGSVHLFYGLSEEVWDLHTQENLIYFVRDRGLSIMETHGSSDKYAVLASLEGRAPIYVCGNTFLLTGKSGTIMQVLDNQPGSYAVKADLEGHEKIINAVGGWGEEYGVTGGYDNYVKLWDLKTFKEVGSAPVPECVNALATASDGSLFLGCSEGFVVKMVKKS